ncbi:MAG: DUF3455 domain-containing protein [Bryobacterales bacterium]|nr:DUF3455 domain-containing protein [Bryobacterales bacterium]
MKTHLLFLVLSATAAAQNVPTNLQVPAGHVLFMKTQAAGTQNYVCLPAANGVAWTFHSPVATLFADYRWLHAEIRQQTMTHFLSPNPMEGGMGRPTWQSSLDTSAVWARAIANSSDPAYVAANSIPWLLLQVTGVRQGMNGSSILAPVTYIQRIQTQGGVAPSNGCTAAEHIGATAMAPYTTDYLFYRAAR